jgi:hypothetical protein
MNITKNLHKLLNDDANKELVLGLIDGYMNNSNMLAVLSMLKSAAKSEWVAEHKGFIFEDDNHMIITNKRLLELAMRHHKYRSKINVTTCADAYRKHLDQQIANVLEVIENTKSEL